MPYMERITWSGVALHEGPLPGYPASHGCIRLTHDFAAAALADRQARGARDRGSQRCGPGRFRPSAPVRAESQAVRGLSPQETIPTSASTRPRRSISLRRRSQARRAPAASRRSRLLHPRPQPQPQARRPRTRCAARSKWAALPWSEHGAGPGARSYRRAGSDRRRSGQAFLRRRSTRTRLSRCPRYPRPGRMSSRSGTPGRSRCSSAAEEKKLFVRQGIEPLFDCRSRSIIPSNRWGRMSSPPWDSPAMAPTCVGI